MSTNTEARDALDALAAKDREIARLRAELSAANIERGQLRAELATAQEDNERLRALICNELVSVNWMQTEGLRYPTRRDAMIAWLSWRLSPK